MIRVAHLISGLQVGGAELSLIKVARGLVHRGFESRVISMTSVGPVALKLTGSGVEVGSLGMRAGRPGPLGVAKLVRILQRYRPHILQTWMYHADLLGALAAKLVPRRLPVIWNIRHSDLCPVATKPLTFLTARFCAQLSGRVPERVICCSEASRDSHVRMGYCANKMAVIPNGFEIGASNSETGVEVRRELRIPEEAPVISMVARFHPQKNHGDFLEAAAIVRSARPNARFLLCGANVTWENPALVSKIDLFGLRDAVHLLGLRNDPERIMRASTVTVSASSSEGFPNVLAEAMALGVVCVATDVGDSARIIGDSGVCVAAGDADGLGRALVGVINADGQSLAILQSRARQRIRGYFNEDTMLTAYSELYKEVFRKCAG
jgi:glycosyltransferase involved in cell wall biosynthesis